MDIEYKVDDRDLEAAQFLDLTRRVWPGDYEPFRVQEALRRTINITAWDGENLVGCVRILTDGYLFGAVPDILVDPEYQQHGIGRHLMDLAWEHAPTSLLVSCQPGNEVFFRKLGFERTTTSYVKRKARVRPAAL